MRQNKLNNVSLSTNCCVQLYRRLSSVSINARILLNSSCRSQVLRMVNVFSRMKQMYRASRSALERALMILSQRSAKVAFLYSARSKKHKRQEKQSISMQIYASLSLVYTFSRCFTFIIIIIIISSSSHNIMHLTKVLFSPCVPLKHFRKR